MKSQVAAWTASLVVGLATALPSVTFPINSQVPPVARIGESFSFLFSPSTFSSDSPLTYTLDKSPQWLSIDSNGRRLFGTPKAEDVGPGEVEGVLVNVVATDKSGSTTHTATLVVSRNKGPKVQIPLEKQVPGFGSFSGPSSILSLPDQPFSFELKPDTFSNPSSSPLGYYAVMADNTPLPAWISFDAGRLSFSGRTPPFESLIQPPQRFAIMLVASDVVGFSGAGLGIDIVVGTHQITTDQTTILLTATPDKAVSYTKLKDSVKVDGKPVTADNVVLASISNLPSWLSVDNSTWHIRGTPPKRATSTNFTITLQDSFSDTLNVSFMVDVASEESKKAGLFKADKPPTFTAAAGKHFSFDLGPYLLNPQDTEISVTTLPSTSWVHFDPSKLTLSGDAPEVTKESVVGVRVEAKSKTTDKLDSLSLLLRLAAVGSDSSDSQPPGSTSTGSGITMAGDGSESKPANLILMAILLPLSFVLFALICGLFRCYRRRKENEKRRPITVRDISGPLPGTFEIKSSAPSTPPSLPAFDLRNFDKSFSVNDVFASEKKNVIVEQRRSAPGPGRPILSPSPTSIRMLPSSMRSKYGSGKRGVPRMPFLGDLSMGRLASSLSSISENSFNDDRGGASMAGDQRSMKFLGRGRRGYFRDAVEIRIPNAPSQSATPSSQQPETETETDSSLSRSSSGQSQHPDTLPLRTESRLGYHPPGQPSKKIAWKSWLKGKNVKRKMPKLSQGPNKQDNNSHSNQSSISTVDTFDYKRHSSRLSSQRGNTASSSTWAPPKMTPIPLPPARLIGKVHLARPVTRKGPVTKASVEAIISSGTSMNPVTPKGPRPQQSQPLPRSHRPQQPSLGGGKKGVSLPVLPNWRDTPEEFLSLSYENLVKDSPFHPSASWSTIPAGSAAGGAVAGNNNNHGDEDEDEDNWVDETVESLASPISIIGGRGQEVNWKVVGPESSPIKEEVSITDWDAGTEKDGGTTTTSSPLKGQVGNEEGKGDEVKGKEKEMPDGGACGDLARKGHAHKPSKVYSEASKDESDYAVYI
ncbi:hypothetical protein QBC38DRAFT_49939 [Podospora fimiseda]|uniref:Dystroglycan-type cadherin-like domain-containing protein n=1 Tax=Podospora fimiseda TaxID=252190 RepID=A0AAN7BVF4_9PEZI|nr:hypothetical protein QBC38DRAFT_49939 [Podospora fimiseda]